MQQLRDYQSDCLDRSLVSYKGGMNRQLAVLATGLGKTAIAANLRSHHGFHKKVIFAVHMETLAVQAATAMQRWNPDLRVGVEMAGSWVDMDGLYPPDVIVASIPTLGRKGSDRIKRFDPFDFDCLIQDECFPAGTLIDGRRIETIQLGDTVSSVDVETGDIEPKRVTGLSRRHATSLVKLHFNNGDSLVCTPEHPFWTDKHKWVAAKDLSHYTVARRYYVRPDLRSMRKELSKTVFHQENDPYVLGAVQAGEAEAETEGGNGAVRGVRNPSGVQGEESLHGAARKGLLFPSTRKGSSAPYGSRERAESRYEDILRTHANQQSHERFGGKAQDGGNVEGDGPSSTAGRKRKASADSPDVDGDGFGVADGSSRFHAAWLSTLLQDRHRKFGYENRDRGRRRFSFLNDPQGTGSTEGCVFEGTRVDRVEVLEPTSPEFTGDMLGTCEVYNLAVEGYNNYLADGYLVHNCHIGISDSFKRVYDHFGLLEPNPDGLLFLGITATPNRSDGKGLRELFDVIVFDMGIETGIAQGWLCDIRGIRVRGHANLDGVKTRLGDFAQDELEKSVNTPERNAIIVKEWYKVAFGKKTLCFTVDVQHALDLAAAFTAHGEQAEAVWGDDPQRHEKIRRHKTGEYKVLCNCNVLAIGYDDPEIQCIISAAPTKSELRYVQQIGRGTRICDGKQNCTVIDVVDNCKKHSLTTISTLLGLPKDLDLKGESYSKAKQKLDRMAAEFPQANVQDIKSLDQLKSIAENISLFQTNHPPEIARLSELAWRKSAEGYCLAVNRDLVQVTQDLRGDWAVKGRVGEAVADFTAQNLPGAMNVADRFILDNGGIKPLLDREARWRTRPDPPSEKQIGLCRILRITIPPGATKAQVSMAIDNKKAQMRVNA